MLDSDFRPALTPAERLRLRCNLDAVTAAAFEVTESELRTILRGCDRPQGFDPRDGSDDVRFAKDFWRVDKDKDPELRQTVLTLVAFNDLEEKVRACSGDRPSGIEAFLAQNGGDGWMVPETLRLADFDLGHDDRAKEHQPVASLLGPRFYDWQLLQSDEESWHECHLHARNLLGEEGYRDFIAEVKDEKSGERTPTAMSPPTVAQILSAQESLFE
jgi:hypothetical protein